MNKVDTKAVLGAKRRKLLHIARQLPALDLRVLPLAQAFGVSSRTVRIWLNEAGIKFVARRGRPKAGQSAGLQGIEELIKSSFQIGQHIFESAPLDAEELGENGESEPEQAE